MSLWRRRRPARKKLVFAEEILIDFHDLNVTSSLLNNAMFDHQLGALETIDQGDVGGNAMGGIRDKAPRREEKITLNNSGRHFHAG